MFIMKTNNNKFILNNKTKHGLSSHKLYSIWEAMVQRCSNENNKVFKHYGKRGVNICTDWRINFMSFYNWSIDNGYKKGLTIDRINNDGNYEPNNCRWVKQSIQIRNTRRVRITNISGYRGVGFYKKTNRFR